VASDTRSLYYWDWCLSISASVPDLPDCPHWLTAHSPQTGAAPAAQAAYWNAPPRAKSSQISLSPLIWESLKRLGPGIDPGLSPTVDPRTLGGLSGSLGDPASKHATWTYNAQLVQVPLQRQRIEGRRWRKASPY